MIKPLLLSVLVAASVVALAQNSDSSSIPTLRPIACAVETGPPSQIPHKWVGVSAGVMAKYKIHGKNPEYPLEAKIARAEGRVVLVVMISVSGDIEDLCVSQGPEVLQQAAFDAVKTWKYKPFVLNGQPVEVKTQINVEFALP